MMIIGGKTYIEKRVFNEALTVPDCWVAQSNKIGKAHGEKKLYFGSKSKLIGHFANGTMKCVVLKEDLDKYLNLVEREYLNPKNKYNAGASLGRLFWYRKGMVFSKSDEMHFDVQYQNQIAGRRGYVNSTSNVFQLIREIALPLVSYISILELEEQGNPQNVLYYWKLFVDYVQLVNPQHANHLVFKYGKRNAVARPGQALFRQQVIRRFSGKCVVTGVDEPDLLVASHIKPWALCDRIKGKDHINPENGLLLSTLYDRLFDQGFITFDENCKIEYSKWLSEANRRRLGLLPSPNVKFPINNAVKEYLEYHHVYIFKG